MPSPEGRLEAVPEEMCRLRSVNPMRDRRPATFFRPALLGAHEEKKRSKRATFARLAGSGTALTCSAACRSGRRPNLHSDDGMRLARLGALPRGIIDDTTPFSCRPGVPADLLVRLPSGLCPRWACRMQRDCGLWQGRGNAGRRCAEKRRRDQASMSAQAAMNAV